jgi:hypothetical protein
VLVESETERGKRVSEVPCFEGHSEAEKYSCLKWSRVGKEATGRNHKSRAKTPMEIEHMLNAGLLKSLCCGIDRMPCQVLTVCTRYFNKGDDT